MTVYHGTNKAVKYPSISISEIGREFGIGFYVTPDAEVAKNRAKRKGKQSSLYGNNCPVVSAYDFDLNAAKNTFHCRILEELSEEWLDFIMKCYMDIHFVHPYDIVFGPMVTPELSLVLSDYRSCKNGKAETIHLLSKCMPVMQVCFSTADSLSCLNFLGSECL